MSVVLPPVTGMNRCHSQPASREPGLMLVISPSLSFTTGCPERRSPCGANRYHRLLHLAFSPTQIPNSESSLTPAFPHIPHPTHQQIFWAFGLNAVTVTTASVIFLLNGFSGCLQFLSFLQLIHSPFLTQKKEWSECCSEPFSDVASPSDHMARVMGLPWQSSG